jgi:hypothetical protein
MIPGFCINTTTFKNRFGLRKRARTAHHGSSKASPHGGSNCDAASGSNGGSLEKHRGWRGQLVVGGGEMRSYDFVCVFLRLTAVMPLVRWVSGGFVGDESAEFGPH